MVRLVVFMVVHRLVKMIRIAYETSSYIRYYSDISQYITVKHKCSIYFLKIKKLFKSM